ncbi:hypothetical protein AB0C02_26130 [Micromonospora sp. NPDC048999]|uniref:nickel/cobalt transporter n=1 Tax=Micromonospora sp. NPDC048999 TaxID=3155391 RepID=UPI0034092F20
MKRHICTITLAATLLTVGAGLCQATPAAAHPLGNFTVNHYHGLRLHPDRIDDLAVLDEAEIPTLQHKPAVDSNGDGTVSPNEQATYAATTCTAMANTLHTEAAGRTLTWHVTASTFTYRPGAANLPTARLECHLTTTISLRQPTTINIEDRFQTDRIGWHEITANGDGVGINSSPVPTTSISDELRKYPDDLLSSPLNQRSVRLRTTTPGTGTTATGAVTIPLAGPLVRSVGALGNRLNALTGAHRLTPLAGILGIALALLLGAAHAMLPGHGKTIMAAYIAGRRGTYRDAVTVGATVTVSHTAAVLAVGLLLTTATSLAGELILGWLGAISGLLITAIGAALLKSALTRRPRPREPSPAPALVGSASPHESNTQIHNPTSNHHDHGKSHHDHHHGHGHGHGHRHAPPRRAGLLGMGIAGGIVPSPSALIVLLGAIALGRTWFGVLLVIAYGLGMAATLTLAGLLLVRLHNGLRTAKLPPWSGAWPGRLATATPILTATLVLALGVTLTLRAVGSL